MTTRLLRCICVVAMLAVGCAPDDRGSRPELVSSGSSLRQTGLGVAALFRAPRETALADIPVEVDLFDGRRRVASLASTLPFCGAGAACWWAESYTRGPDGTDLSAVDRVAVVPGRGRRIAAAPEVTELRLSARRPVRAPSAGLVILVLTDGDQPVWGSFVRADRAGDSIAPPPDVERGEHVRGFFYPGPHDDGGSAGGD